MTDDVFIYFVDLPNGINEAVIPCFCGYTIYIGKNLPYEEQVKAYQHALFHIQNDDFSKMDVQEIESDAHRKAG